MKTKEKQHVDMGKLSVKELIKRCFVKRSSVLYPKSEYTYPDDVPEQLEAMEGFISWETFGDDWDVLWVGLDPRTLNWVIGRHLSPARKVVTPVKIVLLDERTKRMQVGVEDRKNINTLEVPFKEPLPETEEDRIISESLSGRVIVDEPDEDKAMRMIEKNMEMLKNQMAILNKKK